MLDPEDRETVLERFTCPRQPKGDRLCLADFFRPKESGELDVVALQAVTVGSEVTELMAQLEQEGEFAEQLFVHGLGVQTAEGLAEWLHWRVRNDLGIAVTPGPPLLVGLPGRARTSPSTSRSSGCSTSRRSAWRSPTATRRSRSSRRSRWSPTTRRPATTACATAACCPTARPTTSIRGTAARPVALRRRRQRSKRPPRRRHGLNVRRLLVALAVLALGGCGENT